MSRGRLAAAAAFLGAAGLGAGLWLGLSGGPGGPSQAAYLERVSTVCRGYARRLERVPAPSEPAAYGDVAAAVRQAVPLLEREAAAMRAVPAPAALEPRLRHLFVLNGRSVAVLRAAGAAARRRDAGGVARALLLFARTRDRVHVLAAGIGIDCAVN